jgi:hypothetical protein
MRLIRSSATMAAAAMVAIALMASPTSAAAPAGSCSEAFDLLSQQQLVHLLFELNREQGQTLQETKAIVQGAIDKFDKNEDAFLCVKDLPQEGFVNVVDNSLPLSE